MDNSQTEEKAEKEEESNSASEDEFWDTLEQVPSTQPPTVSKSGTRGPSLDVDPISSPLDRLNQRVRGVVEPHQELTDNSRFERSLGILRAAKRVEVQTATRMARNQVKVTCTSA